MTDMKKIMFFAALMFAALSCSKESRDNSPVEPALAPNQFSAGAPASKVTINDSWALFWEAGDAVSINDGSATTEFHATTAGASTILEADGFEADASKTYVAVYPAADGLAFDGSSVTLAVAGDRTATPGVYPAAPAVAVTGGDVRSFGFANVCGLVSFCITESNVTSVVLFGGNEENLAGTVSVNCSTGAVSSISSGEKSILLTPASGTAFTTGRYYVAVLPQNFASGMSISLYKTDGTRVRRNTGAFNLVRSTHVDLENVDENRSWKTEYSIKNADELQAFLAVADQLPAEANVSLANDIDLSGVTLIPASSFAGTFDGAGHSLINWTADGPLFSSVSSGATVQDVVIAASCTLNLKEVSGGAYQGFIAASSAGTISGCTNKADITYTMASGTALRTRRLGAIVGHSTGIVSDCHNEGDISITIPMLTNADATYQHQNVAGVVGSFASTSGTEAVKGCTNSGNISYTFNGVSADNLRPFFNIGGVVAQGSSGSPAKSSAAVNNGTVKDCTNSGSIHLTMNDINGSNYTSIGGVAGYLEGSIDGCTNASSGSVTFTNTANNSKRTSAPAVGGVAATVLCGSVSGCSNAAAVRLEANVQNGSSDAAYAGGTEMPSIGGVVAKVGKTTEDSSLSISDCTNSGAVSVNASGGTPNMCLGGIVGWTSIPVTGSAADKLQNSGTVTIEQNGITKAYVGGVIGRSISTFDKLYNTATGTVSVSMDDTKAEQAYVGGIAGFMSKLVDAVTFKQGINNAAVSLSGGKSSSTSISYIGGVVGKTAAQKVAANGTAWAQCNSNYGDVTVNSPVAVYVGGVLGEAGATTGGTGETKQCKNRGNISVTSPKDGSCIGGVVGRHCRGKLGDANNAGIEGDKVSITVTGATSSTYVGGYVGQVNTNNGPNYPSCCTTISGGGLYIDSISASGATAGLVVGNITMTGASTTNGIMVCASGQYLTYYSGAKLNGTTVGPVSSSLSLDTFFGTITPSTTTTKTKTDSTPLAGTYYFCASGSTTEVDFFSNDKLFNGALRTY